MKAFIRPKTLLALALVCGAAAVLFAVEPAWWVHRGVRDPSKDASDYAALNQGQLKNLARAARDEMEAKLPGGAGPMINDLVNGWNTPTAATADYAAVNVGQLKAVAKPFYDRWAELGIAVPLPWNASGTGAHDFSVANVGQAKHAFTFQVLGDTDGDGVNDTWEMQYFGTLNRDLSLDFDGDGLSDYEDWLAHLNPLLWDTDQNGTADGQSGTGNLGLIVYSNLEK